MSKNKSELVKQIEAYGLKGKLADLATQGRGQKTIPSLTQNSFSKGILIGKHSDRTQEAHRHKICVRDSRHAGSQTTARRHQSKTDCHTGSTPPSR